MTSAFCLGKVSHELSKVSPFTSYEGGLIMSLFSLFIQKDFRTDLVKSIFLVHRFLVLVICYYSYSCYNIFMKNILLKYKLTINFSNITTKFQCHYICNS
jgi:hypothetical protein